MKAPLRRRGGDGGRVSNADTTHATASRLGALALAVAAIWEARARASRKGIET